MKTIILIAFLAILFFFFIARTTVHFNPFSIKFGRPLYAVGALFLIIGMGTMNYASETKGYNDAVKDVIKLALKNRETADKTQE